MQNSSSNKKMGHVTKIDIPIREEEGSQTNTNVFKRAEGEGQKILSLLA